MVRSEVWRGGGVVRCGEEEVSSEMWRGGGVEGWSE